MSTRVHELAKELGVQSKDLLDRIQEWGLPVKPSIFAGLDPAMVEEIRDRHKNAPGSSAPTPTGTSTKSTPAEAARGSAHSSETPAIRPPSPAPSKPNAGAAVESTAPPEPAAAPPAPETARPAVPTPTAPPAAAPVTAGPAPAQPPAAPRSPATSPASGPAATEQPRPRPAQGGGLNAPPSGSSMQGAPRPGGDASARPGGLTNPPRPAAGGPGPLSRHTHRGAPQPGGGPGGPPPQQQQGERGPDQGRPQAHGQRPQGPPPQQPRPEHQQRPPMGDRPPSQQSGPLTRGDYISPTGTRAPLGRPQNIGSQPPQRRSDQEGGPGGDRPRDRDSGGPRRPLPSVAMPSAPPPGPRRPDMGPRPGGPEVKTQRPEMKFTREQLLEMRQKGELGGAPTAPPRPGAPGQRPQQPSRFPSQPAGGPGQRAPMPPPGGPPPLRRGPAPPIAAPPPVVPVDDEEDRKGKGKGPGGATDRAGRRAKRDQRANDRSRVSSPLPASVLITEDDDPRQSRGPRKGIHKHGHRQNAGPQKKSTADLEPPITVRTLSEAIGVKAADLIRKLMQNFNQMVHINANLDEETAQMLALEFGVELHIVRERTAEDDLLAEWDTDDAEGDADLADRPPVVTILGHVDHGKTSLLDRIRRSNVVDTESGGITQHIGAYQVVHEGKNITFVDTPGHEAFTEMRARGANVTDIVVLVVAADDGVMPQTVEAIAHAKAAEVPIIIALNKIDLPNVNINKIYGELSQQGLVPEEYGGDTPVIKTSATQGIGIADLLEMIGIVAELRCTLKANPKRNASGTCLEALITEGRGAIARVIVQDGTLRVGDIMVCGDGFGRVRALFDDKGRSIEEAGPSTPVEVSGLDSVPNAGEKFGVVDDIGRAREIAEARRERSRGVNLSERQAITLENLFDKMAEQKVKSLNIILKADVQGSLEALSKELEKLVNPEVPIRVLHKAVGGISESDIILADASQAIVIGFRVAPEDRAVTLAEEKKIDIRRYDIIYQVTDEIKKAVEGMLIPEIKEVHLGRAVVRQLFKISKVGTVAGCFVTQGLIERSAKARVLRDGREIYKGAIEALKRFKDDVKEVRENFECGIKITNFDDLKSDDVIEAYRIDVIRRTL